MSNTLRYLTTAVLMLALCGLPATASASPAASAAPAPVPALAATPVAAGPVLAHNNYKSKKSCYYYKSGKKHWTSCKQHKSKSKSDGKHGKQYPQKQYPKATPKGNGGNCNTIYGVHGGTRPGHRAALDYMASGSLGQSIANYGLQQMRSGQCGVKYVIYRQTYYGPGAPSGKRMEDRGSATQNHFDHVHIEY